MPIRKADDNGEKKLGTYKEVSAMKFNLKEGRYLQKNLHLIDIEKQFSLNLINLDSRDVRLRYKVMKENVSKIRSHLTAAEITEFRRLDENGQMHGIYTSVTPNLKARISTEAKRLRMRPQPSRPSTVVTLMRRTSTVGTTTRPSTSSTVSRLVPLTADSDVINEDRFENAVVRPMSENIALHRRETIRNALMGHENNPNKVAKTGASKTIHRYQKSQKTLSDTIEHYKENKNASVEYGVFDPTGERLSSESLTNLRRSNTQTEEKLKAPVSINRTKSMTEKLTASLSVDQKSESGSISHDFPPSSSLQDSKPDEITSDSQKPPRRPRHRPSRPISSVQHVVIDEDDGISQNGLRTPRDWNSSMNSGSTLSFKEKLQRKGKMQIPSTKTYTSEEIIKLRNKESSKCGEDQTTSSLSIENLDLPLKDIGDNDQIKVQESGIGQNLDQSVKQNFNKKRPSTTGGVISHRSETSTVEGKRPQTSRPSFQGTQEIKRRKSRSNSFLGTSLGRASNSAFSCHTNAEKDEREKMSPRGVQVETGRTRQFDDEIQDNLGENIHKELRKDLLAKEQEVASKVGDRVTGFMKRLDSYIQREKAREADAERSLKLLMLTPR